MKFVEREKYEESPEVKEESPPRLVSSEMGLFPIELAQQQTAFEKNYPKNIFIPLIEHLGQLGLKKHYEECVGTRESFEGKNVVSLAEIHKVLSQGWFEEGINLPALVSNMSNKILMNSKIKKKLFHLLLIRELFHVPRDDPREFKKMVSKLANEAASTKLPQDPLFSHPSALIYLLSLFTEGLSGWKNLGMGRQFHQPYPTDDKSGKYFNNQESGSGFGTKAKEISSKQEYKYYISKIISVLNSFHQDPADLLDILESIKTHVAQREAQIREKYRLPHMVPAWGHFATIVINNCYSYKRNKHKITFSLLSQWIQEFKEKATNMKGYTELSQAEESTFRPIVLVLPPL